MFNLYTLEINCNNIDNINKTQIIYRKLLITLIIFKKIIYLIINI